VRHHLIFIIFISIHASALPATIFVPDDYPTIQEAINAVFKDDIIIVREGTWTGPGNKNLNFNGKAITLCSETGPKNCIIDCKGGGRGLYFNSGETEESVVDGFTITSGDVSSDGGAVYCENSSPTLRNCIFNGNSANNGGGMCNYRSNPTITNCIFSKNSAAGYGLYYCGGGMYNDDSNPTLTNCAFSGNSAAGGGYFYNGGGMGNNSSNPTLTKCTFTKNLADYNGGGMYNEDFSSPNLTNCTFSGNSAWAWGGGMYNGESNPTLINCTLSENSAGSGGGVSNHWVKFINGPTLNNCSFNGNSASYFGGGMYNEDSNTILTNCTFRGNSAVDNGGGLYNHSSTPTLANCILWYNGDSNGWNYESSQIYVYSGTPIINYCCIEGWTGSLGGSGNIGNDPRWVDPTVRDFHLTWNSPCRNAGDNSVVTELHDFEGDPRIHDGTVDMGADEFHIHLYHTDPVVPGTWVTTRVIGRPDSGIVVAEGSGFKETPIPTPYGDLYIEAPVVRYLLETIPSSGACIVRTEVPTHWIAGKKYPFQAFIGDERMLTNLMLVTIE